MKDDIQYDKLLKLIIILSFITIGYNLAEGIVSVIFGLADNTLALLGFGLDSFAEVVSGIGIAHMIFRMKYSNADSADDFEKLALKITGVCFYVLTAGLVLGAAAKLLQNSKPDTTVPGLIISVVSIFSMYFLMKYKLKAGRALQSDAVIADANCTKTCLNLSVILLISSLIYIFVRIGYIDLIGSLGIAYYSFKEGKESFEKAKSENLACSCGHE